MTCKAAVDMVAAVEVVDMEVSLQAKARVYLLHVYLVACVKLLGWAGNS